MLELDLTEVDLMDAFEAGQEMVERNWHHEEFCGTSCTCAELPPLNYNSFDDWFNEFLKKRK